MSKMSLAMRSNRYHIRNDKNVSLVFSTPLQEEITLRLKDLSASGVCGNASIQESKFIPNEANTPIGTIFPEAKIVWDQHEYQLGRIAVRRLKSSSDQVEIAFNSIDTQIPVSGELTKILDIDFAKEDMRKDRELDPNFFHLGNFLHNEDTSVDLFNRVREYQVFYKEFEKSKAKFELRKKTFTPLVETILRRVKKSNPY